jgi:acyl transferase domain-containing protein/acyl carrier protein
MAAASNPTPLEQAYTVIRRLESIASHREAIASAPLAIIGLACRFPGAADEAAFLDLLRDARDVVSDPPDHRLPLLQLPEGERATITTLRGAYLDQVDEFDPEFFNISPREAVDLDPQQRLALEVSWEALEDAGLILPELRDSRCGVYLGMGQADYGRYLLEPRRVEHISAYAGTGTQLGAAAGRIAYCLGIRGPCLTVDTACSSSLTAIHLASRALRAGDCDLAFCGGVQLNLFPESFVFLSRAGALAPDGRCKTFDADADGYGRGEGCGMLVLKRMEDALRDGDRIRAVVRGSAINHDGSSSGFTVPNGLAQRALMRSALEDARLRAHQVQFVEAHGTGTVLGDPIEVEAIADVYGQGRDAGSPLYLGSVKASIGHLEAAAGVAGVIKSVLALENGFIPPQSNFRRPNPRIDWARSPIRVAEPDTPWPAVDGLRCAAVSAFGLSGSNAHVLIVGPPTLEAEPVREEPTHLLTLTARTMPALHSLARAVRERLEREPQLDAARLCYTANRKRTAFECRLALVGRSRDDLSRGLLNFERRRSMPNLSFGEAQHPPRLVFLFTGQESIYKRMGVELYRHEPIFRSRFDELDAIVRAETSRSVAELLYRDPDAAEPARASAQSVLGQAALYILQMALVATLDGWGVRPDWVLGHGLGEFAAAGCAGVFSADDGLRLLIQRARIVAGLPEDGGRFAEAVARVPLARPSTPYLSATDGCPASEALCQPAYWGRHLREPVRFDQAIQHLAGERGLVLVELGPRPDLLPLVRDLGLSDPGLVPTLRPGRDSIHMLNRALVRLFARGIDPDWSGYYRHRPAQAVPFPHYPFQRRRFWSPSVPESPSRPSGRSGFWDEIARSPLLPGILVTSRLDGDRRRLLDDHAVHSQVVIPGAYYLAMVAAAHRHLHGIGCTLEDVVFPKAFVLTGRSETALHLLFEAAQPGHGVFRVASVPADGPATVHMEGRCAPMEHDSDREQADLTAIRRRCPDTYAAELFYQRLDRRGIGLGPRFRWHDQLWWGSGEALGRLRRSTAEGDAEPDDSPGLVDACFQLVSALLPESVSAWIPFSLGRCRFHRDDLRDAAWCHAVLRGITDDPHVDLRLLDEAGRPLLTLGEVVLRPVTSSQLHPAAKPLHANRDRVEPETSSPSDLAGSLPFDEARTRLNHVLRDAVRAVLDTDQPIKPTSSFFELGMDSLMALELRDRLQAELSLRLPATLVFDYPSSEQLAGFLLDEFGRHDSRPLPNVTAPEHLSEQELERLLMRKVRELEGKGTP